MASFQLTLHIKAISSEFFKATLAFELVLKSYITNARTSPGHGERLISTDFNLLLCLSREELSGSSKIQEHGKN